MGKNEFSKNLFARRKIVICLIISLTHSSHDAQKGKSFGGKSRFDKTFLLRADSEALFLIAKKYKKKSTLEGAFAE